MKVSCLYGFLMYYRLADGLKLTSNYDNLRYGIGKFRRVIRFLDFKREITFLELPRVLLTSSHLHQEYSRTKFSRNQIKSIWNSYFKNPDLHYLMIPFELSVTHPYLRGLLVPNWSHYHPRYLSFPNVPYSFREYPWNTNIFDLITKEPKFLGSIGNKAIFPFQWDTWFLDLELIHYYKEIVTRLLASNPITPVLIHYILLCDDKKSSRIEYLQAALRRHVGENDALGLFIASFISGKNNPIFFGKLLGFLMESFNEESSISLKCFWHGKLLISAVKWYSDESCLNKFVIEFLERYPVEEQSLIIMNFLAIKLNIKNLYLFKSDFPFAAELNARFPMIPMFWGSLRDRVKRWIESKRSQGYLIPPTDPCNIDQALRIYAGRKCQLLHPEFPFPFRIIDENDEVVEFRTVKELLPFIIKVLWKAKGWIVEGENGTFELRIGLRRRPRDLIVKTLTLGFMVYEYDVLNLSDKFWELIYKSTLSPYWDIRLDLNITQYVPLAAILEDNHRRSLSK